LKSFIVSCRRAGIAVVVSIVFLGTIFSSKITLMAQNVNRDLTVSHLNAIINWYRDCSTKVQSVGLPSDLVYQQTSQNMAQEAVRLAFQSAKASAQLVDAADKGAATGGASAGNSGGSATQSNFAEMLAKVNLRIQTDQTQLDAVVQQLASAPGAKRQALQSKRDAMQAELDLDKATQDALQKMSTFVTSTSDSAAGGLAGTINELERTVPELNQDNSTQKSTAPKVAAAPAKASV
jgi:hypothetical protein